MNMRKTRHEHEEVLSAGGRDWLCLFRRDAEGGYLVTCEEMPPMIAYGETLERARESAREELEGWAEWQGSDFGPLRILRRGGDEPAIRRLKPRQTP